MLKIRLRRMGRKKAPHYRIVVAESSMPRDGRFVAKVGHYNPRTEPMTLVVDRDRVRDWLSKGAQPTDTVATLLRRAGVHDESLTGVYGVKTPSALEEAAEAVSETAAKAAGAAKKAASKAAGAAKDAAEKVAEAASDAAEAVTEAVAGEGEEKAEEKAEAEGEEKAGG